MTDVPEFGPRTAIIRTSDRGTFKRCRRRWGLSSHFHHNRTETESAEYLWLGKGCHYALEDFHGYNYYKHPVEAFRAFVTANRLANKYNKRVALPMSIDEQVTLGEALLEYYMVWLEGRDPYQTLWVDGVPQVEVKCYIPLPFKNEYYDEVYYQAELDRVVVIDDELWVLDYKFYNRDWTPNLDFDLQMESYIWVISHLYANQSASAKGAIVQKHFKKVPDVPRILSTGRISSDKNQNTTPRLYRQALLDQYGDIERAPLANRRCYEYLLQSEGINKDNYIQRDTTMKSEAQIRSTGQSIMLELSEMLNPHLPLYKNNTKDCSWDCKTFQDICLMMDDGQDWEFILKETTVDRQEEDSSWRQYLPHLT